MAKEMASQFVLANDTPSTYHKLTAPFLTPVAAIPLYAVVWRALRKEADAAPPTRARGPP